LPPEPLITLDVTFDTRALDEGDGLTLEGRIVPYDEVIDLPSGREAFAPGVFADTDPDSVVLLYQHDPTRPVGRMTAAEDRADGLYGTFRFGTTAAATEARSLAADRILRGLSVGFEPVESRKEKDVRVHTKARLRETSLVTFPAYPGASVLAVREEGKPMTDEKPVPEPAPDPAPEPAPEPDPEFRAAVVDLETRMDNGFREVRNMIANVHLGDPAIPERSVQSYLAEMLVTVAKSPGEKRALADVIGTAPGNASGLIYSQRVSEVLNAIAGLRPLFDAAGKVPFPSSGYGLNFPRITQHTQVAKRTAEKAEAASRELTLDQGQFAMEWFAGAVDVSLELIAQSDPSVLEVVVDDLLAQYAVATEAEFASDSVASATAGGAVLPVSTWAAFAAAVIGTSADIRAATGIPGDRLALTDASWAAVVGLLNPAAPAANPGTAPDLTAEAINVGGVLAFHAPALASDLQFNTRSLRNSERTPDTVSSNNVALMGRDIGIIGATIALPLYPAGIVKYTV
jgi:HK97 family phage prohead protease